MKTGTTPSIQINADDAGSRVVFTPQDKDKFVLGCKDAIRYAQVGLGWNAISDELRGLFEHVRSWSQGQTDIARCEVRPIDGRLIVYVVPKTGRFDLSLAERLTDLDLQISQQFQNLLCDVFQAPVIEDLASATS